MSNANDRKDRAYDTRPAERPSRAPSLWVGYVCGVAATAAALALGVVLFSEYNYVTGVVIFAMAAGFTVAQAVNKCRRYGAAQPVSERPVSEELPPPEAAPSAAKLVGRQQEGKYVISELEMAKVCARPKDFDNVLSASAPSLLGQPARWFIALSQDAALAFNADRSQVWSLHPDSVVLERFVNPHQARFLVRAEGGRSEQLTVEAPAVLAAWQSRTWDECVHQLLAKAPPAVQKVLPHWGLLVWALQRNVSLPPYVNVMPPYATVEEGLITLASQPDVLRDVVKWVGPIEAANWQQHVTGDTRERISAAVCELAPAYATKMRMRGSIVGLFGAALVALGIYAFTLPDEDDLNIAFVIMILLGLGVLAIAVRLFRTAGQALHNSRR